MSEDERVPARGEALIPDNDRPRGVLSKDDREFLRGEKEFDHVESNANARARIRGRIINAILDFSLIETYLEDRDRERVFDAFDADNIYNEDADLYAERSAQYNALSDLIAFIYRETQDRHPPFEQILRHGISQGENNPGAVYYGSYKVELNVEEAPPAENININSLVERVERGETDTLTESEMAAFMRLFAASDAFDEEFVRDEFEERMEMIEQSAPTLSRFGVDFEYLMMQPTDPEDPQQPDHSEDDSN